MRTAILIGTLLALLVASGWLAVEGWGLHSEVDMPASAYVAMALGIIFSLAVGVALMALVFYSSRKGYDEAGSQHRGPREHG